MTQLCFCQESYPRKQIQQGDTVVVITPVQLGLVNGIIQERDNYRDELVPALETVITQQDTMMSLLNEKVKYWERIDQVNQSIIKNLEEQNIEVLKQKRKDCWLVGGICLSVGTIVGMIIFAR